MENLLEYDIIRKVFKNSHTWYLQSKITGNDWDLQKKIWKHRAFLGVQPTTQPQSINPKSKYVSKT